MASKYIMPDTSGSSSNSGQNVSVKIKFGINNKGEVVPKISYGKNKFGVPKIYYLKKADDGSGQWKYIYDGKNKRLENATIIKYIDTFIDRKGKLIDEDGKAKKWITVPTNVSVGENPFEMDARQKAAQSEKMLEMAGQVFEDDKQGIITISGVKYKKDAGGNLIPISYKGIGGTEIKFSEDPVQRIEQIKGVTLGDTTAPFNKMVDYTDKDGIKYKYNTLSGTYVRELKPKPGGGGDIDIDIAGTKRPELYSIPEEYRKMYLDLKGDKTSIKKSRKSAGPGAVLESLLEGVTKGAIEKGSENISRRSKEKQFEKTMMPKIADAYGVERDKLTLGTGLDVAEKKKFEDVYARTVEFANILVDARKALNDWIKEDPKRKKEIKGMTFEAILQTQPILAPFYNKLQTMNYRNWLMSQKSENKGSSAQNMFLNMLNTEPVPANK